MLKRLFESYLLLSRWLLAPFLAILTLALFGLVVKAGKKAWSLVSLIAEGQDLHVTLAMLNLIDITLIGALVVIVILSIYDNFVSRFSSGRSRRLAGMDRPHRLFATQIETDGHHRRHHGDRIARSLHRRG